PEPVSRKYCRVVRRKDLDHHLPAQCAFLGEEDPAHAAAAQFAFEPVGAPQSGLQSVEELIHYGMGGCWVSSRSKRGLPRSGANSRPPRSRATELVIHGSSHHASSRY